MMETTSDDDVRRLKILFVAIMQSAGASNYNSLGEGERPASKSEILDAAKGLLRGMLRSHAEARHIAKLEAFIAKQTKVVAREMARSLN